jgi:CDP-diacylglycerol--serine O-phosphatidyltransferase
VSAEEPFEDAAVVEGGFRRRLGRRRRRRREREKRRRDFAQLLPHLLTTGNLAAGFYAIVKAMEGDADRAALALVVAGVCDNLDGRIARLARATSRFGLEYDSIADAVSFGVAPAIIAFTAGSLHELGWTGWVLAFMYTACAALRLARFNVSPGRYRGRFEGLPSPAAAGMVVASVWFAGFLREGGYPLDPPPALAGLGAAALGLLMVSPIPYRSFKELRVRGRYRATVLMVIAFAVILSKPSVTFFLVGLAYVAHGPIEWWWRRRTGRSLDEASAAAEISATVPAEPGTGATT